MSVAVTQGEMTDAIASTFSGHYCFTAEGTFEVLRLRGDSWPRLVSSCRIHWLSFPLLGTVHLHFDSLLLVACAAMGSDAVHKT